MTAPFRMVIEPVVAPTLGRWAAALPWALALLALHGGWVFASRRRFRRVASEGPLGGGGRLRQAAWSPTLTRLRPTGPAALAITWKNIAATARLRRVLVLAAGLLAVAIASVVAANTRPVLAEIIAGFAIVWAGAFVLIGPQWVRNDLRTDLQHLPSLRAWPLGGAAIVTGEVLASTVTLTATQLGLLFLAGAAATAAGMTTPSDWPAGAAVAVLAAIPLFNWLHLLVHNGLAVLYPGWVPLGPEPRTGVEGLGQQAIVLVAGALGLGLLLLPAGVAAGLGWSAARVLGGTEDAAAWAAGAATVVGALAGSAAAVRFIGGRLARLEPGDLERDAAASAAAH
jgi:hypothetical protein